MLDVEWAGKRGMMEYINTSMLDKLIGMAVHMAVMAQTEQIHIDWGGCFIHRLGGHSSKRGMPL